MAWGREPVTAWGPISAAAFRLQALRMRQVMPHYKPCLLLLALDLIDEGVASAHHVPLRELAKRFEERLTLARLAGADRAFMPAWHLARVSGTAHPFWELIARGQVVEQPAPNSTAALLQRADAVQFLPDIAHELESQGGRYLARLAILERLELDGSPEAAQLLQVFPDDQREMEAADRSLDRVESDEFHLDDPDAGMTTGARSSVMRSSRFATRVVKLYARSCALCRVRLEWNGMTDIQAAHVKQRSQRGAEDARNGLALCASHHWAFDHYLWTAEDDLTVRIQSARADRGDDTSPLVRIAAAVGGRLALPSDPRLRPHPLALGWHRERFEAQVGV